MKRLCSILLSLSLLLFTSASFAQNAAKITGKITDGKSAEALIGATVLIEGTTKGAAANIDGVYTINSVAPGRYTITIKYIGYTSKQVSDVEVKAGAVTTLNVVLDAVPAKTLNTVTVKGTFRQESTNALYAQQKNRAVVSDGITSESIRRSPDRNTSDVLKRVSGATVQDNKFVVIRGLSDRYNNASLDGASLPSTEPNRKAFSFDIVPSNLVDNIVISKTATPDMAADFTGGSIQIQTRDIPESNFASFGIGGGYNTASTFKDFKSGKRNFTDYLGFDNGAKALPNNFPSQAQISAGLTPTQNISTAAAFNRDNRIYTSTALPTQNYQFTLGRVKDFKDNANKFGALFSVTYRNAQNINSDVERRYVDYNYLDQVYRFSTSVGAIANFAYTYGKSKIAFKNIFNRNYDDSFLSRDGYNSARNRDQKYFAFDLMQKQLFKSTVEGTHGIGKDNSKINWSVSYANILNDQPDQKKTLYQRNPSDAGSANYVYVASTDNLNRENSRLFTKLNEDNYSGGLNYTKPLQMFGQQATFKTGLSSIYRKRNFDARFTGLRANTSLNGEFDGINTRGLATLYGIDAINRGAYAVEDISGPADGYNAHSMTNAAYLMLDNKIGEKSRLVWGLRAEQFKVVLDARVPSPETSVDDNYLDLLPSVNYTYAITPKINFRASYYRTLARPEFRELSATQIYDYELIAVQQGSPDLKESKIDNADIRFEFYPQAGQIISVSGFYKKFHNAIETYNQDSGSARILTYLNTNQVDVYGVEFEFRKSLEFIANNDFMKKTTFYTNLSFIHSQVETANTGINLINTKRPMVGQAPYIINAGLQHSFLGDKLNFNALYNKVGRRLVAAGGALFPEIWDSPRNVVDLQIAMRMLKNKGELKFNAGDILNNRVAQYYDDNGNKKFDVGADQTVSSFKPGANYSLTFSYTF